MKLREDRAAWVEHCRSAQAADKQRRQSDDGMSHGIIPFGAVTMWAHQEAQRQAQALATPLIARVAVDRCASGLVALAVTCPFCRQAHSYVLDADALESRLETPLQASCGRGAYRVQLPPSRSAF